MISFDRFVACVTLGLMLSITVAQNPLAKLADSLSTKYKREEQAKICRRVAEMKDVYEGYTRDMFVAGCRWDLIQVNLTILAKKDKKRAAFWKAIEDKDSKFNEDAQNHCAEGAADWQREGNVREFIMNDLYNQLKCEEVLDIM